MTIHSRQSAVLPPQTQNKISKQVIPTVKSVGSSIVNRLKLKWEEISSFISGNHRNKIVLNNVSVAPTNQQVTKIQGIANLETKSEATLDSSSILLNKKEAMSTRRLPTLHEALYQADEETLKYLVEHSDLQEKDKDGYTPFEIAVQAGKKEWARRILERILQVTNSSLGIIHALVTTKEEEAERNVSSLNGLLNAKDEQLQSISKEHITHIMNMREHETLEHHPALIEMIKKNDIDGFLKYVACGASIFIKDHATNKTLLHIAAEHRSYDILLYLLGEYNYLEIANQEEVIAKNPKFKEEISKVKAHTLIQDNQGRTALDIAKKDGIFDKLCTEFDQGNFSAETTTQYMQFFRKKMQYQAQSRFHQNIEAIKTGHFGHNSLLLHALEKKDWKQFFRFFLEGANTDTVDLKTQTRLVHWAIMSGQLEVTHFLLKNAKSIGSYSLALAKKQSDKMVELVKYHQKREGSFNSQTAPSFIGQLDKNVENYIEEYQKASKNFPASELRQREKCAKYGSSGHNPMVVNSIEKGNIIGLIEAHKFGAPLNTFSVSEKIVLEDPTGFGMMEHNSQQLFDSKSKGKGKTLLDIAVRSAVFRKTNNLEIISYLLNQGLDPFEINDEGDTPLSIALLSNQYQAAFLMMSHQRKGILPIDKLRNSRKFQRAFDMMVECAQARDPLKTKWSAVKIASLASLLIRLNPFGLAQTLHAVLPLLDPFVLIENLSLSSPNASLGDYLAKRHIQIAPESIVKLHGKKPVQKAIDTITNAYFMESIIKMSGLNGVGNTSGIGTIGAMTYRTMMGAFTTFMNLKLVGKYFNTRPLQALYKLGVESIMPARFAIELSSAWSKEKIVDSVEPQSMDPKTAKTLLESYSATSWDQEAYKENPEKYVKKLWKGASLNTHPDKGGDKDISISINNAKDVLLEKIKYESSWSSSINDIPSPITTAAKLALAFGGTYLSSAARKKFTAFMVFSPLILQLGKGGYNILTHALSNVYDQQQQ